MMDKVAVRVTCSVAVRMHQQTEEHCAAFRRGMVSAMQQIASVVPRPTLKKAPVVCKAHTQAATTAYIGHRPEM
jgi:hypothetical protein